jgi:hypothetical protein
VIFGKDGEFVQWPLAKAEQDKVFSADHAPSSVVRGTEYATTGHER